MPRTPLRRSLVAVATAVACVALMATPAAATTHDATITGGVITLTKTGFSMTIDLSPAASTACTPGTLTLDENGTTITVTDLDRIQRIPFLAGSYLLVITRSPTGGTAGTLDSSTTPHTITGMRVPFVFTFYNTTGCTPSGTPLCTAAAVLDLTGTTTSTTASHTFGLTGASVGTVVAFPTCTAGPPVLGTTATVTTALTGHLTT